MTTSVRLPNRIEQALAAYCVETRRSKSEVIIELLEQRFSLARRKSPPMNGPKPPDSSAAWRARKRPAATRNGPAPPSRPSIARHEHHPGGHRPPGGPVRQARQTPRNLQDLPQELPRSPAHHLGGADRALPSGPSAEATLPLYRWIDNAGLEVFSIGRDELVRAVDWIERYADQPMDMADAPLVVVALTTGHNQVWTLDRRDFETWRLLSRKRFKLLKVLRGTEVAALQALDERE